MAVEAIIKERSRYPTFDIHRLEVLVTGRAVAILTGD